MENGYNMLSFDSIEIQKVRLGIFSVWSRCVIVSSITLSVIRRIYITQVFVFN